LCDSEHTAAQFLRLADEGGSRSAAVERAAIQAANVARFGGVSFFGTPAHPTLSEGRGVKIEIIVAGALIAAAILWNGYADRPYQAAAVDRCVAAVVETWGRQSRTNTRAAS